MGKSGVNNWAKCDYKIKCFTHTSELRSITPISRSSPSRVIFWGLFAVTLGTSKLFPNSKGLTLIMTTLSSELATLVGLNKSSLFGTLLKLNWVGSKGLLTFCRSWGTRLCVALSVFNLFKRHTGILLHCHNRFPLLWKTCQLWNLVLNQSTTHIWH